MFGKKKYVKIPLSLVVDISKNLPAARFYFADKARMYSTLDSAQSYYNGMSDKVEEIEVAVKAFLQKKGVLNANR